MSSNLECDRFINNPEQTKLTSIEQATQKIKDFIWSDDLTYVRLQAFIDLVKYSEISSLYISSGYTELNKKKLDLQIKKQEQHAKRYPGYESEYEKSQSLRDLYIASGCNHEQISELLIRIRDEALGSKSIGTTRSS